MKKMGWVLLALLILVSLTGCGSSGVTQEEYDAAMAQVESLQKDLEESRQKLAEAEQSAKKALEAEQAAKEALEAAQAAAQAADVTPEPVPSEEPAPTPEPTPEPEETPEDTEVFDVSETEIRGGTNQADAMQLPMNTKVHGTLHDAQNMYLSFHTGAGANSTYQITVIDKNPTDIEKKIGFYVFDVFGTELASEKAYGDGIASTLTVDGLSPDTDYYIRLVALNRYSNSTGDTVPFALTIRDPDAQAEGIDTTSDLVNAIVPLDDVENLVAGTNQDDAALIPFDKTLSGELKDKIGGWFAFATTDNAENSYLISVVNRSGATDESKIGFYVFDELGEELSSGSALNDGITKTITLDNLLPNTVYYIRLAGLDRYSHLSGNIFGYVLTVRCQNNAAEANTATVEEAKETAVFETPFELTSAQVQFVANEAAFVDRAAAKEALAPVAEIILAHPDHPILLAGTTATFGVQERCVALSNRRADAVKALLVSEFGVSEEQLLTVGLGYADDPFVRGRDVDANGRFIETEGAKNRRVIVLDAESDIAREILGN